MLRPVFTLLFCFLAILAIAQGPSFRGLPHDPPNTEALDEQFGEYHVFRIDPKALNAYAKAESGSRPFRLLLGDLYDWNLEIFARDIRAANCSILVATESGVTEMRAGENNTFRGELLQAGGGMVSLTLDKDFIYGYITDGDEEYFIEPLWYFTPDASKDLFVVYPASKVIPVEGKTCGVTEMKEHKPHIDPEDIPEVGNCLRLELAIANDWAMRQKYGSNAGVINHNVGVMNNVQNNYDNEFIDEIEFFIVQHFISSCSTCDPWTSSTNPDVLLDSFTDWGPSGFSAVHDLGQLWTNRDLDGPVIGIAWLNAVCTSIRYHVLQDFTGNAQLLRVLTAHEIGHNFSATHDPQGSNTIMAPTVNNTNTWSNQSINQINNFIQVVDPPNGCLAFCPPPCALTVNVSATPNTVCSGQPSVLTATPSGGTAPFTYSWSNGGSQQTTTVNPTSTTTYSVTVTDGAGCVGTGSVTVTVSPPPTPVATNNSPICQGGTLVLAASGGVTYNWSGPNGFSSNLPNPTIANAQPFHSGTYSVTVTNASGCSASTATFALVNPNPGAVAGSNSPVCQGNAINLNAGGGASYSWSGPNGYTSNQQNPVIPNAQITNGGQYSVTVTLNGCTNAASTTVVVNPSPTASASGNSPVCQGETIQLNGSGSGGSISWSGPGGFSSNEQNPSVPNAQPPNSGLYTLTVANANGCTATASASVTVTLLPTPAAGNSSPVCEGATLFLAASGGSAYSWSGPNGFTSNLPNPTIPNVQSANAGTYSVTVTNASCSATTTTFVVVNTVPAAAASSNGPVCEGATLSLSASGGSSYAWSGPNGFTSNQQNPSIANAQVLNSGTYTVTVTAAGCSATSSVQVTVTPLLNPVAGSNAPVCEGDDIQLAASGGMSYSWSGPNGYNSNEQNPVIENAQAGDAGTYSVVVTGNGCSAIASSTVAVNTVPEPSAASNTPVCIGSDLMLMAEGGASYSWSGPNGFSSNEQNPVLPNAQAGNAGIYTATVSNGNCSASTQLNVEVNPGPAAIAAGNGPLCEGETIQLSASGGDTYSWSGPNSFSSNEQNPVIPNAQPGDSGTYTVTVTAPGCSASAMTTVEVRPLPAPQAASNAPVCEGETIQLSAANGDTYDWSGPDGFSSGEQNPTISESTLLNAGIYTVTVANNGCSASESVAVTINALPKPEAQSNTPVCEGEDILLTATGGTSYSWSGPGGFASSQQNPLIPGASSLNAGEYTVIVTLNGCSTDAKALVIVNPLPQAEAGGSAVVCEGETIFLTSGGGETYLWSGPGGFVSTEQNPVIPAAQVENGGEYFVMVNLNGCEASAQALVAVTPLPEAAASGSSPLCEGETIQLIASGGNAYAWSGPGGFSSGLSEPAISNALPGNSGMYVVVVSENGCSASAEVEILVNPLPEALAAANGPLCQGETLALSASGGESYSWTGPNGFLSEEQNPSIGEVQTGDAGMYEVMVSSAGCSSTAAVMLEVNLVTAQASSTDETCHDCNDGTATVVAEGAGGYTYLWSNGAAEAAVSGLAPGTYTVTVSGDNGCTAVVSIVITPFGCPAIEGQVSIEGPACQGDLATVAVTPDNGVAPYGFLWSTGETTQIVVVPAGVYTVNITDADGCPGTLEVIVEEGPEVIPVIEGDTFVCDGEAGTLSASGGSAFLWNTGETSPVITWTQSGEYSVEVTEGTCTVSTSVTVEVNPPLVLELGQIDGQVVAVASGGAGNFSYLWNTGETTSSITPTEPGIYSVTVTDEKGCKAAGEVDFTVSASEAGKQQIRIYPNPTLHRVSVEAPAGLEGWIYAHDLLGNLIASQPLGFGEVDLSGQAAGSYLLQVVVGEEVYRVKVVKQ